MRIPRSLLVVVLVLAALSGVAGCSSSGGAPSGGDSGGMGHGSSAACPPAPTLTAPPRRVVTMDGGAAAVLGRLGLADRIVGTAAPDFIRAFSGPERVVLDRIPVLDDRQGNAESVIAARPDLVVGISALSFGGFPGTPSVDRLRRAGAAALVACSGERSGGPGTDIAPTLEFVQQTADLFGVPDRGRAVVAGIRGEIAAAAPPAGSAPVRVLQLSGAPSAGQPVLTRGGPSLATGVIALAGGTNIAADVDQDFASISAEQVAARDPQAIVVVTGFSPLSDEELTAAVTSSPVMAGTTAVREKRIVAIPQSTFSSPSVLNGQAVATLAATLRAPAR